MSDVENLPYVEAELNYLAPISERPRYNYDTGPGELFDRPPLAAHTVRIHDLRPLGPEVDLDRQGFALVEQRSKVRNFWDEEEVRRAYYPELAEFVGATTGARRVHVFAHVYRRRDPSVPLDHPIRQPAMWVHIDRSSGSIGSSFIWRSMRRTRLERLRQLLGEEADELLRGRCQVITLWRPIRGPVLDTPLAVCDARTVEPEDLVASDMIYQERVAESQSVMHNPAHGWYYAPEMSADEGLLIKCSDTRADVAQFSPHAAFTHPTTPPGARPRESIETRMLVFHPA